MQPGRAILTVAAALVSAAAAGSNAAAQGMEWVSPGVYDFGSCGGLGGDSVPGMRERYYRQSACLRAYDPDRCDTQARWYRQQFFERKNDRCESWLRSEAANCRATVRNLAQRCYDLAN